MQGGSPLLNTMTLPPGATTTQARMVLDGVRGAIFLYSNGGPHGALVGSWAISAGTDPYGNAYPAGFDVSNAAIESGDQIINSAGQFIYSSTPAAGNLIYSNANVAGTDGFGNTYLAGDTRYNNTSRIAFNWSLNGLTVYSFTAQPGATFTATGAVVINSAGYFQYSAAPAAGNLIYSNVPNLFAGGSDPFGNVYLPGLTLYNNNLTNGLAFNISNEGIYFYTATIKNPGANWVVGANFTTDPVNTPLGVQLQIGNTPNDFFLSNVNNLGGAPINVTANGLLTTTPADTQVYRADTVDLVHGAINISTLAAVTLATIKISSGMFYAIDIYFGLFGSQNAGAAVISLANGTATVPNVVGSFTVLGGAPATVLFNNAVPGAQSITLGLNVANVGHMHVQFLAGTTGTLLFQAAASVAGDQFDMVYTDVFVRPIF